VLRSVVSCATVRPRYSVSTAAPELRNLFVNSAMADAFSGFATGPPSEMNAGEGSHKQEEPGAGAGLWAYKAGMPVTCDPALVARMLRNLRSACGSRLTTGGLWSRPSVRPTRPQSKAAHPPEPTPQNLGANAARPPR